MTPTLSIIIVSWNVREHLRRCLASIEKARGDLSLEVFVVDNASTDGTAEFVRGLQITDYRLQIILNEKNRGFAAANNQGIRQATGEYVLLLNPDTELTPLYKGERPASNALSVAMTGGEGVRASSLALLLDFMESHQRCGILGSKLLHSDGTLQQSVRRFPDAWGPLLLSLGMTPQHYLATDFDYTRAAEVDQVMGACFLIRRKVIEAIGLLDEKFFIWFEEVDYCKRAKNSGWEVWYTPEVSVMHHGGESFAQERTLRKQWWYSKSLLYYFSKHRQWDAWILHLLTVPLRLLFAFFYGFRRS